MVGTHPPVTPGKTLKVGPGCDDEHGRGGQLPELGTTMTDTRELDVITEALAIIDRGLGEMLHRELVSTDEVADLLLDVRTRLTTQDEPAAN
jgi:hypothetical protein